MKIYKHYSFDLWLTLIRSNPDFKQERARIFQASYNPLKKTLDEVLAVFRQVDLMVNSINERTGKNIDAEEMYLLVVSILNDYDPGFGSIDPYRLYLEMEVLLFNYLPVVYCEHTPAVLDKLKSNGVSTLSLLSNTGFIKGSTLRKVLEQIGLAQYLDFQLYSDEERLSKPNPAFFRLMMDRIDRKKHAELDLSEILHVGDNPAADIDGAAQTGIQSLLINSNHQKITCLQ